MEKWKTAIERGLVSGSTASALSTVALAAMGKHEAGSGFAPTNAVSHWIWGDQAARHDGPSLRYTLPGYLIHHASATFWAVLFERFMGERLDRSSVVRTVQAATATSAVACFVDYQLTPQRLHPGYEKRLSRPALAVVYGAFGLGLAAGALLCRRAD
ncbi:hypothetical protein [Massilia sp. CF038]|uniref:hypothetical protein n=1 Tax=Massilia sp. CF038 TaxID=1881045 RepID=UPI000921770D|nr:hypothetical protein [Massilia sp. CF038]SHH45932.1 hypothetical protein SAMN05428948_4126 [Massilia sp. CF038]